MLRNGARMTTASNPAKQPTWLSGSVAAALPPLLPTFGGALLWAIAMGAGATLVLVLENWEAPHKIRTVAAFFALGGFVAFPFGMIMARLLSYRRPPEVAFASALVSLAFVTVCATGGLYALDYRSYYAEWHADAFTRIWFLQFTHTIAAALYQFAVLGLRLFFPFGFVALVIASAWFSRGTR